MKISTKGRYGLRCMADLAIHSKGEHVPLNIIAERQDISVNYLEQVFSVLRKSGLVKSIKGPQGGYVLADNPSNITAGLIIRNLEGELTVVSKDNVLDNDIDKIINNKVWIQMNNSLNEVADSITLQDLVNEYERITKSSSMMYYI